MKILQLHSRYRSSAPSGENSVVDQERDALIAAGHVVDRFERSSDEISDWPLPRKAALPVTMLWNPTVGRELLRRIDRSRPDVVHVHNTFPMLSPSVLHACRDAGVPLVATLHNYKLLCASGDFFRDGRVCHDCADGSLTPALAHGCYRGSHLATLPVVATTGTHRTAWRNLVSAYVFISASQRDLMRALDLPRERVFVKHNFVPEVISPPQSRQAEHLVAYLGRLDAAKGVSFLMRAWDVFRSTYPESDLRLAVAGAGPLDGEVREWARSRPSVDVLGLLAPAEATELLRRALAAVVPSQWEETFGLVAVEAMASAVAPIAPARGSFPELVTHGVDGVLYAPDEAAALAETFHHVDAFPDRFVGYGRCGRATYEQRFRADPNVERLLDIYRFAVSHPAGAATGTPSPSRAPRPPGEHLRRRR